MSVSVNSGVGLNVVGGSEDVGLEDDGMTKLADLPLIDIVIDLFRPT